MSAATMEGNAMRGSHPLDIIRDSLASIIEAGRPVLSIARRASEIAGIRAEAVLSPSREPAVCWVRFAVMLSASREGCSLARIGRALERDHATVIRGEARARKIVQIDSAFEALAGGSRPRPTASSG